MTNKICMSFQGIKCLEKETNCLSTQNIIDKQFEKDSE